MESRSSQIVTLVILLTLFILLIRFVFSKTAFHLLRGLPFYIRWNLEFRNYAHSLKEYVQEVKFAGSEKLLSEIYLPARLRRSPSLTHSNAQEVIINIYKAIEQSTGPMLVVGEPGSGKSVLARYLVNRVLDPYNKQLDPNLRGIGARRANRWYPIFVNLADEIVQEKLSFFLKKDSGKDTFVQWLTLVTFLYKYREKNGHVSPEEHESKRRKKNPLAWAVKLFELLILRQGYALIVIDGLEQVTEKYDGQAIHHKFVKSLSYFVGSSFFSNPIRHNLLLITSRFTEEVNGLKRSNCWELCHLTPTRYSKAQFIEKLFSLNELRAKEIANILSKNTNVAWFMSNPLILGMGASILNDELRSTQDREDSTSDLLNSPFGREFVCAKFIEKRWLWAQHAVDVEFLQVQKIMGKLAYDILHSKDNRLAIDRDTLDSTIQKILGDVPLNITDVRWEIIGRAEYLYPVTPFQLNVKRSRILKFLGLIFFADNQVRLESERYVFQHFTLQEYFAYWYVCYSNMLSKEEQRQQILSLLNNVWWREVVIMYLGQNLHTPEWIQKTYSSFTNSEIRFRRKKELDGIPPQFKDRLFETLSRCGPFDSHKEFQALFIDARIWPWKLDLKECNSKRNRISEAINLLWDKFSAEGENALYLFLYVLSEQVHGDTSCRNDLMRLADLWESFVFEVDKLESVDDLNTLLLLLCVLYEYKLKYEKLIEHSSELEIYQTVRFMVVRKVLAHINPKTNEVWNATLEIVNSDVGDVLADEEWCLVENRLESREDSRTRLAAIQFCGQIGGQKGIELLVQHLPDPDKAVGEAIVKALQLRISRVADDLKENMPDEVLSVNEKRKARRIIRALSAYDNPNLISDLLVWGERYSDISIQNEIRKAIVKIGHNQYSDIIDQRLLWYLEHSEHMVYLLVFEAFVEAGNRLVESLLAVLCDPTQRKRHNAIVDIFCEQGKKLASVNAKVPAWYQAMVSTLLFSDQKDNVRYALRILHNIDINWGKSLIEELCKDEAASVCHKYGLRQHLKSLRRSDTGQDYYSMIEESMNIVRPIAPWDWLKCIFQA